MVGINHSQMGCLLLLYPHYISIAAYPWSKSTNSCAVESVESVEMSQGFPKVFPLGFSTYQSVRSCTRLGNYSIFSLDKMLLYPTIIRCYYILIMEKLEQHIVFHDIPSYCIVVHCVSHSFDIPIYHSHPIVVQLLPISHDIVIHPRTISKTS